MKNTRCLRWLGWLIMVAIFVPIYLAGCVSPPSSPTAPTSQPSEMPLPSPALPLATRALLPSPASNTATPSPTHTPTSPTPTPRPTLAAEEERAFVREMLATNGGCELPCWWGITPGKSQWADVQDRLGLYPGRGILRSWPDGVSFGITYGDLKYPSPPPYGYYISIGFFMDHGEVVRSITVEGEVIQRTTPERFAQDWHRYSLDQVLRRYGKPSQVMLELWPNPPEPYYPYRLFLFYEELGILIEYEGPAIPGKTFLQVCPVFEQVTSLRLWLQSPKQESSLLQLADLDPLELAQMLPLEKATGMDVQTFYKTFKEARAGVCLESPADVWP